MTMPPFLKHPRQSHRRREQKVDRLVYELYSLTEAEIALV